MKKTVTWVLIADGARATVLANDGPGRGLRPAPPGEIETELHPNREIVSDRPGRVYESATSARHAVTPRIDWHRVEKVEFAQRLAQILDQAAREGLFHRLVLVAPPRTLGDLRAALDEKTLKLVTAEIGKDLTNTPPAELPAHLGEALRL